MATYDELSIANRFFMKSYPFSRYRIDPVPCAPLTKPLNRTRIALITTAGLHTADQAPFGTMAAGDCSFREIPDGIEIRNLVESHKSNAFNHAGIKIDKNLVFPLERFRELVERGDIGETNHRHFSFMGSIIKPGRLIEETAPQVASLLAEDRVDVVFLTPA